MGGFRWSICVLVMVLAGCVDLARPTGLVKVTPQNPSDAGGDGRPAERPGAADGAEGGVPEDMSQGEPSDDGPAPGIEDGGVDVDVDVGTGDPTDAGEVNGPAPLPAGSACSLAGQCASGFCADGVCCNQACTGLCQACDLSGSTGSCSPVVAGQDPDNECAEDPLMLCRQDGTCDGQGACRQYPVGTQCQPPRCSGSTLYAESKCAGVGVCQAGASASCAPLTCSDDSCRKSCTGDGDCLGGYSCIAGSCKAKVALGAACTSPLQCGTGFCVDGVCCAVACGGLCQACNLPGSLGACTPVPSGADPAAECAAQAAGSCGRIGGCDGKGACRVEAAGTSCGAGASCTGSTETGARTCNGAGVCQTATTRSCGPYVCSGTTCASSCSTVAGCASGHKCTGGGCLPLKITGLTVHDTARAASWSQQLDFQIGPGGARPWVEWPNTYVASIDAGASVLLGNEWIKLATDSKTYTGGPQATLTLGAAADVYLIVDDRWGAIPSWTAGYTNTGFDIRVFENTTRPALPFSVFRRTVSAGSVTLPSIGATTAYNYLVVVR